MYKTMLVVVLDMSYIVDCIDLACTLDIRRLTWTRGVLSIMSINSQSVHVNPCPLKHLPPVSISLDYG